MKTDYNKITGRVNKGLNLKTVKSKRDYQILLTKRLGYKPSADQLDTFWGITNKRELFHSKAKGTNLRKDKFKQARTVITVPINYIRVGANKVDLRGFDTKTAYGWNKEGKRELIDSNKTRVVKLKNHYTRKGKIVYRKDKYRLYVYNREGRRIGLIKR